ncbi:MAG: hypothetical protein OXC54_10590, partial [Rhodospirillaceae bacterium]|nr:hypothetical protein [Rhodospirillaceae bacterium]
MVFHNANWTVSHMLQQRSGATYWSIWPTLGPYGQRLQSREAAETVREDHEIKKVDHFVRNGHFQTLCALPSFEGVEPPVRFGGA